MTEDRHPPLDVVTGEVTIFDFDRAILEHVGAVIGQYTNSIGQEIPSWIMNVSGVEGDIKIDVDRPDTTFDKELIPYIDVISEFPEEARERQFGPCALAYEVTDKDDPDDKVKERILPLPYNFRYTLNAFIHLNKEKKILSLFLLKKFKNFGTIKVRDSLGFERVYLYESEGGSDITDIVDFA